MRLEVSKSPDDGHLATPAESSCSKFRQVQFLGRCGEHLRGGRHAEAARRETHEESGIADIVLLLPRSGSSDRERPVPEAGGLAGATRLTTGKNNAIDPGPRLSGRPFLPTSGNVRKYPLGRNGGDSARSAHLDVDETIIDA